MYFVFFFSIFRQKERVDQKFDGSPMGNFHNSIRNQFKCTGDSVRQNIQMLSWIQCPIKTLCHCNVSQFHPIQLFHKIFSFFFICREKEKRRKKKNHDAEWFGRWQNWWIENSIVQPSGHSVQCIEKQKFHHSIGSIGKPNGCIYHQCASVCACLVNRRKTVQTKPNVYYVKNDNKGLNLNESKYPKAHNRFQIKDVQQRERERAKKQKHRNRGWEWERDREFYEYEPFHLQCTLR